MNKLIFLIIIAFTFFGCHEKQSVQLKRFAGQAQGTYYAISYYDKNAVDYQIQIDSLLNEFDMTASMWEPNSIISAINNNDTGIILNNAFIEIFNQAFEVSEKTNGAFDITVGPLIDIWGFGTKDRSKITQVLIDSLLPLINYKAVRLKNNKLIKDNPAIHIDFNAIAQGYSVDLLANFLESKGIKSYLIDIGGEVFGKGKKADGSYWRVGIEKPSNNSEQRELEAKVFLHNKALATSGSYRKFYIENGIKYSHTIDPTTGYPVTHSLLSVSVLSNDATTADAFATALMVLGLERSLEFLKENKELAAFFIYSDNNGNLKTFATEGMKKILIK
jgi:FAD:protein FMN transferase